MNTKEDEKEEELTAADIVVNVLICIAVVLLTYLALKVLGRNWNGCAAAS